MRADRHAWLLAACLAPALAAAGPLRVENRLAECVRVQPGLRSVEHNVVLQQFDLTVVRPIGDCGCKSALVAYQASIVYEDGARGASQSGVFGAMRSGPRTLPLASDAALLGERPVALGLGCAPAD